MNELWKWKCRLGLGNKKQLSERSHFKRVKQAIGEVVNDGSDNTSQGSHQQQNKKLFTYPFPLPATWAILTKNEGMVNGISDWAQQTTEGMYADAVSDAECGGDSKNE